MCVRVVLVDSIYDPRMDDMSKRVNISLYVYGSQGYVPCRYFAHLLTSHVQ